MKQLVILLSVMLAASSLQAQSMQAYFAKRGSVVLAQAAHVMDAENAFYYQYDVEDDYVLITVYFNYHSLTNTYEGPLTVIRLDKGLGGLYFNRIAAVREEKAGFFSAFMGLKIESAMLLGIIEKTDPKTYNDIKQKMIDNLNTNPENWNGATWALLAINLDYADYLLNN